MRLKAWFRQQRPLLGAKERLARAAGVSRPTVYAGERGLITDVRVAKAISVATKGAVTVDDLTHATKAQGAHVKVASG